MSFLKNLKKLMRTVSLIFLGFTIGFIALGFFFWITFFDNAPDIAGSGWLLLVGLICIAGSFIMGCFTMKKVIMKLLVSMIVCCCVGLVLLIVSGLLYLMIVD